MAGSSRHRLLATAAAGAAATTVGAPTIARAVPGGGHQMEPSPLRLLDARIDAAEARLDAAQTALDQARATVRGRAGRLSDARMAAWDARARAAFPGLHAAHRW